MATYIDNIVKFHTFSKSPVSKDTTLGGAVNPSGHTVTTSQVRAQDIPAFLNTFQGTKEQAITWLGNNYPTPAHNDIVFYGGEFKAGFSTPKCLKWNSKLETPAWEDFDITTAATLKNADDKDVIAVHQNCTTVFVDGSNNAATNSNRNSLFVKKADGSILDHFVASTDKIVAGMPSLGYNALVLWNGGAIDEGELDANYIGNTFAGIVHLNKQYSTGDDAKFKVTCFEYIGDKLDTALSDIDGKIQDIVGTTMEGVVASVGTTDAAANAGISVDSETKTSPKIDISTGTVGGDSDAKLVTGSTVKTYVDSATEKATVSAEGVITEGDENKLVTATDAQNLAKAAIEAAISGTEDADGAIEAAIEAAIADATLDDTDNAIANSSPTADEGEVPTEKKLVTAEQVKEYVSENAKVTLTADTATDKTGITISPNGQESTSFTIGIDQTTIATKKSVDDLSDVVSGVSQTITNVQTDVQAAQNTANAKVADVTVDNSSIVGDDKVAKLTTTGEAEIVSSTTTSTNLATEVSVAKSVKTLEGKIDAITTGDGSIGSRLEAVEGTANSAVQTVTAPGAVKNDTTVTITAATLNTDNKSFTNDGYFVKASDVVTVATTIANDAVDKIETTGTAEIEANAEATSTKLATEASVAKTAQTLTTAIDAIAGVGVSYEVLGDSVKHESVAAPVKGRIYLEKDETAADGTYIEWFYTGTAWEKIGSTKADHSVYAKTITINKETKTVSANAVDLGKAATSVTSGNGITSGSVSDTGALSLTLDEAGTDKKGIVQLASTHDANDTTKAATGLTVAAAISGIASTSQSENGITVTTEGGSVTSVTVNTTSLVSDEDTLIDTVTDDNLITAADALEAIKLAKPENYVASVTGYTTAGAEVTTTQGAAVKVLDGRGTSVTANDLWGTSVTTDGETITVDHKYLSNPNANQYRAWNTSVKSVKDNKAYTSTDATGEPLCNIQTEMIKDGSYMFNSTSLESFSSDLSSLVDGSYMFADTALTSFDGDLSSLVNSNTMFYSTSLASFNGDLSSLVNGSGMFSMASLASFSGDLSSLVNGSGMFSATQLASFSSDLSSLVNGSGMFTQTSLTSFSGDLSSLVNGDRMFYNTSLASFNGDLSSLVDGTWMFRATKLDTESVECIADTIRNVTELSESTITGSDGETYNVSKRIDIGIADKTPLVNEEENAAFWTMHNDKGWDVYVNGSAYNPTEPTAIATLDENGEEVVTPIPFWAKPVETDEEHAEYVGEDGKFYRVLGGQFIYVSDPETYGQFTSLADAVANMRLTKIEKKA